MVHENSNSEQFYGCFPHKSGISSISNIFLQILHYFPKLTIGSWPNNNFNHQAKIT
jgi:hypothetical protein